jgi:tetratricopeptide (TPR) repeat protein
MRAIKLDLTDPAHAPALSSLVVDLAAQDRGQEALDRADVALRSNPDAAALHEVKGQAISLSGGDPDDARSAWSRATELDPASALALRGLGSLEEAAGNADAALVFYGRATTADPYDTEALQAAADLLVREGRVKEAVGRLDLVLERNPYDGQAALELAKLLLEQDAISARNRAIVLLLGAERFGGGAEASRALADLGAGRGPTP